MTSIAKLKDRARKLEQQEEWSAAIDAYKLVLDREEAEGEFETDLGLANRIGDLYLRLGQAEEAVSYYVTAADKYADAGFYNNAIALCNKALRHRPEQNDLYLKLSNLCAQQGFQTDARRWILEYADRQMRSGFAEPAFTALAEFADMTDDPEVRETLADHLASHNHPKDAVDQLRLAHELRRSRGEGEAAEALAEKARSLDPSARFTDEADPEVKEYGEGLAEEPPDGDQAAVHGLGGQVEGVEPSDGGSGVLEGFETTGRDFEPGSEPGGVGLEGLERHPGEDVREEPESPEEPEEPEPPEPPEPPVESETAAGTVSEMEVGAEAEASEELDPLPLLEEPELDEEPTEEAEPLPLLDFGFEPDEEFEEAGGPEVEGGVEVERSEESETLEEFAAPREPEEPEERDEVEELPVAETPAVTEDADQPEPALFEGDEDLLGFDLEPTAAVEGGEEGRPEARSQGGRPQDRRPADRRVEDRRSDDRDVGAILELSRDLVGRGLHGEALRELELLPIDEADGQTLDQAFMIVNEIIRRDPADVPALQRRVEYATRLGDVALQVDAYQGLGDALARLGAEPKARAIYERVLELDPDHEDARAALEGLGGADPAFAAMLSQFRSKVSDAEEEEDAGDHYDLGLAFKEMGLLDEAIAEFETELSRVTEPRNALRIYEELGQCLIQKGDFEAAVSVLEGARDVPETEDQDLLGIYYHLGQSYGELGRIDEAREAYGRILAIEPGFADVPDRMAQL
jgi:tetratricopeptide (TPR) repeat protein